MCEDVLSFSASYITFYSTLTHRMGTILADQTAVQLSALPSVFSVSARTLSTQHLTRG